MLQFWKGEEASRPCPHAEEHPRELWGGTGKEKPSAEREIKAFLLICWRWKRGVSVPVAFFWLVSNCNYWGKEQTNNLFFFSSIRKEKIAFLLFTTPPSSTLNKRTTDSIRVLWTRVQRFQRLFLFFSVAKICIRTRKKSTVPARKLFLYPVLICK